MFEVGCWLLLTLWSPYPLGSATQFTTTSSQQEILSVERFPSVNFTSPACRSFLSQHGEDGQLFIQYWAFPEVKRDGVFLELGTLDGRSFSNSYWPPTAAKALQRNRPNAVNFEAAACEKDEGNVTFVGRANGLSGDISQMPDDFVQKYHRTSGQGKEEFHSVQCRHISSMLKEARVDHVDFWTLDVEGAEFTVLATFDWKKVPVHVLVIENDKDENLEFKRRHDLLTSKGMTYIGPLYNNELWVNLKYPEIVFPSNISLT